jgi:ATP-binding cassette, subfamily B, bacterial
MDSDLPPSGRTLRLLVRTTAAADPARALGASASVVAGQCWPLLAAVGVARAVDGAAAGRIDVGSAVLIGLAVLVRVGSRPPLATIAYRLREQATARVERRIVELTCALPGVEHLERPELLNRIAILQNSATAVGSAVATMLEGGATVVQLVVTAILLASVHPVAGLLPFAGLIPFGTGMLKSHYRAELDKESGHLWRAKKGLRIVAWAPEHGPDLRLAGAGDTVRARQDEAVLGLRAAHDRWAIKGGMAQAAGDIAFGAALVATVAYVAHLVSIGSAHPGDLVLTLVLGQRLSSQISDAIEHLTQMMYLLRSLAVLTWLEEETASGRDIGAAQSGAPAPARLEAGIRLENVSFAYPGTDRDVLRDVTLDLRAGDRVALVGENGAGKTTLVSLLCGFYRPTAGRILVDGVALADIDSRAWQERVTAVFQEATRLEVELVSSVGVGDLDEDAVVADPVRVGAAVDRAGLSADVERLPERLLTRLGRRFPGGSELSGGQWQKVAHARSTLRADPILFVLDEPTAALDAQAEHDLFNRIRAGTGAGVTIFVSHRFSTVRDADRIVMLDGGRVVEQGTHEELMALAGKYAALYEQQARHYS